jgi:methylmalonyl-CoA/ethylmalonyl-CoA epimerase
LKFHHIGIACKNLNKSIEIYRKMGYSSSEIIHDPIQKVDLCFMRKINSPIIELVGSDDSNSTLKNILKKNGTTPYHTCYETEHIQNQIEKLNNKGFILLMKPVKAIAFSNRKICFMYNSNFGIIELLEC